jgi:UDP-N-acetylglucosamine:LPS N-acetylglucosamine transferase
MDNANAVTTTGAQNSVAPFSFDFGSEFIKENLPAEKRTELAVVAQNVKLDLAQDVAARTIRLQASSVDMDQTLNKANELAKVKGDFVIQSTHETASGRTEITVRRHSPFIWIVLGAMGLIVIMWLMR